MSMIIILLVKNCLWFRQPNCRVERDTLVLTSAVSIGLFMWDFSCKRLCAEKIFLLWSQWARATYCKDRQIQNGATTGPDVDIQHIMGSGLFQTKHSSLACLQRKQHLDLCLNGLCSVVKPLSVMDYVFQKKLSSQVDINHDDCVLLQFFYR